MKYIVTITAGEASDFITFTDADKAADFMRNILQVKGIDNVAIRVEE